MALAATIDIALRAVSKGFDKAMKKSKQEVTSFKSAVLKSLPGFTKLSSAFSGITSPAAIFTAALAGMAAALMAVRTALRIIIPEIKALDEIVKTARSIGLAVAELERLEYAATILSGITMPELVKGLQQMVRNIGDFKQGTGEAAETLRLLQFRAEDFQSLNTEEMFFTLAKAMSRIPDAATRAHIGMEIFGRSGRKMADFLSYGPERIRELGDELERITKVVSEDEARGIEAANDALETLSRSWKKFVRILTVEVAPVLAVVMQDLSTLLQDPQVVLKQLWQAPGGAGAGRYVGSLFRRAGAAVDEAVKRAKAEDAARRQLELKIERFDSEAKTRESLERQARAVALQFETPLQQYRRQMGELEQVRKYMSAQEYQQASAGYKSRYTEAMAQAQKEAAEQRKKQTEQQRKTNGYLQRMWNNRVILQAARL